MQTRCHLSVLAIKQAEKYGEREAFTYKDFGGSVWKTMSYSRFATLVKEASNALLNLGAKPQDAIGVFSQNCIQYLITDFGAYGVRVMSVPFYATSSEQQIQYMINDAQIRFLFVGEQEQYDKAHRIFPLCHSLERIIVFDRSVRISSHDPAALYFDDFLKLGQGLPRQTEVEALYKQANNEDICNILYTSGTTGESKGVVLTYGQYDAALIANDEAVPIRDKDRIIQFLPVTHIFERGWSYLCFSEGSHIIINTDPHEIQQSMRETHPTSMSSVPRFWEKVYQAVKDKIDRSSSMQQKLFRHALEVGRRYNIDCKSQGRRPSPILAMEYKLMDKLVLRLVPDGGAPQGLLHQLVQLHPGTDAVGTGAERHIVINTHGEGIGLLEHHAHPLAQDVDVHLIFVDVHAVQFDVAGDTAALDQVVHTVQAF